MGEQLTIGFIGQGFIGKSYADDIERRGFNTVRYALEPPYNQNKDKIKDCDIVFIAVPTPTTPDGFDDHILYDVLPLVGTGKVAVIKSTVLPGTTEKLQETFPDIFVVHNPEFLRAATAADDARNPHRTVIGIPKDSEIYRQHARTLLSILPKAPVEVICTAREAELIKYTSNCFLNTKVVYFNLLHDLARQLGADYEVVRSGVISDPRIGDSHTSISHDGGRGAGGFCFIKDFAALSRLYDVACPDDVIGRAVLESIEKKNVALLRESKKDLDLLKGVYGE